jgi:hypothetical protein
MQLMILLVLLFGVFLGFYAFISLIGASIYQKTQNKIFLDNRLIFAIVFIPLGGTGYLLYQVLI